MAEVLVYPDASSLTHAAAERITKVAEAAMVARGHFSIALSGGTTPRALFQLLASEEFQPRIDWDQTYIFWSDERCVPPESQDSNFHMARETLLNYVPVPMGNIFRIRGEIDPTQAAADYESELHEFFSHRVVSGDPQPRFDIILLGMGDDAHTASLFPHTAPIDETEHWVAAHYVEKMSMWRITFTPPALNAAALVLFLVSGEKKAEPLAQVLGETQNPHELPAQVVQPIKGTAVWMVDKDAARLLK